MLKHLLTLIVISITISSCSVEPANNPKKKPNFKKEVNLEIINADNRLGLKLFKLINSNRESKNIFISPASIVSAMGMVINGADGLTLEEFRRAFEIEQYSLDQINDTYAAFISKIPMLDNKTSVSLANSIWYRQNLNLNSQFISNTENYFNAEIRGLNFSDHNSVKIINDWVQSKTRGKIDRIIEEISARDVMYLMNAIYFKGLWQHQFKEKATQKHDFYINPSNHVQCDMMRNHNEYRYFENDSVKVIDLPYGDDVFSMTIILPRRDDDLNEIITDISYQNIEKWIARLSLQEGTLFLPKFKIETAISLNNYFKNIGIRRAFSADEAEFSKIIESYQFYISDVLHKAYLVVDEEGSEAAAVTSVTMKAVSVDPDEFRMVVDRPFIFLIRENSTNLILFMGKVQNPTES
ncbi:serpin family protein [candidate division KSB1 bacterium]|nr:serpin family protein [candidate division KSB1 bacterium]